MSEPDGFFQAFFAGIQAAGLELRDHWHPDDDTAVIYKLRDPISGKVMRFKIEYGAFVDTDADAGSRFAAQAIARFFGSHELSNGGNP